MKKSIVLIPLPSLIKNSFVRSFVLSCSLPAPPSLPLSPSLSPLSPSPPPLSVVCLFPCYVHTAHDSAPPSFVHAGYQGYQGNYLDDLKPDNNRSSQTSAMNSFVRSDYAFTLYIPLIVIYLQLVKIGVNSRCLIFRSLVLCSFQCFCGFAFSIWTGFNKYKTPLVVNVFRRINCIFVLLASTNTKHY